MKEHVKEVKVSRVVMGRIPRGYDLVEGIRTICEQHGIRNGYITGMIGSLKTGRMIYAIPDEDQAVGIRYSDPVEFEGPLEILSTQGSIGTDPDGKLSVHIHMMISDKYMRVFGGHFVEGGNEVLVTGEIVIHEIEGAENKRLFDEESGFHIFKMI